MEGAGEAHLAIFDIKTPLVEKEVVEMKSSCEELQKAEEMELRKQAAKEGIGEAAAEEDVAAEDVNKCDPNATAQDDSKVSKVRDHQRLLARHKIIEKRKEWLETVNNAKKEEQVKQKAEEPGS